MTHTGYVLDDTVLHAYAHDSLTTISLIAHLADRGMRVAVPALALATTKASLNEQQREGLDGMIDNNAVIALAGVTNLAETNELADMFAATEHLDPAAAHTIAVARCFDWEIITHDRKRWQTIEQVLPWPIELVELSDDAP
ncbi:hypothetical protein D7D52_18700 [Nocardia yunnanensis]|uniref:PIN domain-containing protein n=1 Tax=Nocardia yunnanensis TaxID=2382165 RepID=A0A386ZEK1_9NOCA|nr:hypothetical protein [Nocardia yunnanensis]AYF75544.1 hypothetical protein D7D52_18700 [Nocardia yunnanensis]